MQDSFLAAKILQDHFTAATVLIALLLKNPPEEVRTRTLRPCATAPATSS